METHFVEAAEVIEAAEAVVNLGLKNTIDLSNESDASFMWLRL